MYHCDKCEFKSRNKNDVKDYYVIIEQTNHEYGLSLCRNCLDEMVDNISKTIHD